MSDNMPGVYMCLWKTKGAEKIWGWEEPCEQIMMCRHYPGANPSLINFRIITFGSVCVKQRETERRYMR